jgi:hypothetical protein
MTNGRTTTFLSQDSDPAPEHPALPVKPRSFAEEKSETLRLVATQFTIEPWAFWRNLQDLPLTNQQFPVKLAELNAGLIYF